jgi:hypothetical protein
LLGSLEAIVHRAVLGHPAGGDHLLTREVALQLCHDSAGMHGEGPHTEGGTERIELDGEQTVGRLRLPVGLPLVVAGLELRVVETDSGELMPGGGERDHPCTAVSLQRGPEQVREHVVPEMVRGELRLPAGADPHLRGGHDRGIVDQDVEAAVGREEVLGERPHAVEVGEIQRGDLDGSQAARVECGTGHLRASSRHDHGGSCADEGGDRLDAEPGVAASDDGQLSLQIDAGHDLRRCRSGSETGGKRMLCSVHEVMLTPQSRHLMAGCRASRPIRRQQTPARIGAVPPRHSFAERSATARCFPPPAVPPWSSPVRVFGGGVSRSLGLSVARVFSGSRGRPCGSTSATLRDDRRAGS